MASMDVFVARQAILNRRQDLYGYELLFRSNPKQNRFDGTDSFSATSQVISNTLFSAGLEGICGGKRAFINFDRTMILEGAFSILPKDSLVIEILETVEPDDDIVDACARLNESGYILALDDFVHDPKYDRLIEKAQIIKVDLRAGPRAEQKRLVAKYAQKGIRMLAEKVETREEFEWARSIGFDYFQGYFFTKPVVLHGKQISSSKLACLRLLEELQRDELDFDKMRALIKDDVSFSYKLLHFTNSALFAHQSEIRTIEHALMVLGEGGIRRWVTIAAMPVLACNKAPELVVQALMRAQFSERLGRRAGVPAAQNCFLMGLFSLLDALLDRTIEYALKQIKLAPPVERALLGTAPTNDQMAVIYALIRCYETEEWDAVTVFADRLDIPVAEVGEMYVESMAWVAEVNGMCL